MHTAGQRIGQSVSCTAANDADLLEAFHLGRLAQGSDDIQQIIAFLQLIHQHGRSADGCVDQIDSTLLRIMSCHSQGDSLSVLIGTEDDELTRLRLASNQRSLNDKPRHGFIQTSFAYDLIH